MQNGIYLCADGKDHAEEQRLRDGLKPVLQRLNLSLWGRRDIVSGTVWKEEMKKHLASSKYFVVLVSANCLASDMCNVEIQAANYRAIHENLKIVSILIRPVAFFELTELAAYPTLPKSGKTITDYSSADKAWTEVLRDLIETIGTTHRYIA